MATLAVEERECYDKFPILFMISEELAPMPIYEYQCEAASCGHQFEVMQKISDAPPKKCPECGAKKVSKLMSATSFVLKGSGWYQTDIARKEKAQAAKASSTEGKGPEKTDAPAKKPEPATA
jgi:putative FmdB family regulatory protein